MSSPTSTVVAHDIGLDTMPSTPKSNDSTCTTELEAKAKSERKPLAFWMVFAALCLTCLLSALELTSVSTALPTIVHALNGEDFVWVGSAYSLAATAFLPLFGELADIFGRKSVMIFVMVAFMVGSAVSGAAQNMNMLIAGRTIQGMGSGGILSMTEIITADMVPLRERGLYVGIIGAVFAFASAIGPPVGGALADRGQWRWLFYLNLPLGALALGFVIVFLNFKIPQTNLQEKLAQIDWIGNFLVITSTTACTLALTWAGVQHPWSSYQTLVPLLLGFAGFVAFGIWEWKFAKNPVVPMELFSTRTGFSGYFTTFIHGFVSIVFIYYLPVYFQASKEASPVKSAIDIFGAAFTIAPGGIVTGISVLLLQRYSPQNHVGWILTTLGFGLLSTFKVDTGAGMLTGFQIILGFGVGILYASTQYPILASVGVEKVAPALALFTFMRSFANTWGITIGATILQNELSHRLPSDFLSLLPSGLSIAYATIPQIPSLPSPLKEEVKFAFAKSLSTVWYVMIGLSVVGLLGSFLMRELAMHDVTDERFGFEEKQKKEGKEEEGRVSVEEVKA